jgi:hypothetical protein
MTIFLYSILLIILVLSSIEMVMLFLVRHPRILRLFSSKLQNSISYLYVQGERKVMQYLEGCGQYSPDLGYTLKPGTFTFTETEFSNAYFINSVGVRDIEDALRSPEIIILGDSYALGWGVNQDETFSALIGEKTKLKTLNTSIPSFGTVREMLMLRKIDRSKLKCLIIQYCGDDYDENLRYYLNGNLPQIMRAETFRKLTVIHSRPKKYFFGKYVWMKMQKKIGELKAAGAQAASELPVSEVDLFLHVLQQNRDMLESVPMIVFEMNGIHQTNHFTTLLRKKATENSNLAFIRTMKVLDMSQHLSSEHFYLLDDHLTAEGHRIVTDVLYRTLREEKLV